MSQNFLTSPKVCGSQRVLSIYMVQSRVEGFGAQGLWYTAGFLSSELVVGVGLVYLIRATVNAAQISNRHGFLVRDDITDRTEL